MLGSAGPRRARGEVHFHEVGAVDSIADIIAIAVAADDLAPDGVVVSDLPCGYGEVRCQRTPHPRARPGRRSSPKLPD